MNRNLLFLVIGLVAGLLLAFLFQMVGIRPEAEREEIGIVRFEELSSTLERIDTKIDGYQVKQERTLAKLAGEMVGLKAEVRDLRERGEVRVADETEERVMGKERVQPAPQETAKKLDVKNEDTGWVSIIDKSLALVLVEAGLTPFVKGVSPLLTDAGNKIREEDKLYNENRLTIVRRYRGDMEGRISADSEERNRHFIKRREIIDAFRASLIALKAEKQEKK